MSSLVVFGNTLQKHPPRKHGWAYLDQITAQAIYEAGSGGHRGLPSFYRQINSHVSRVQQLSFIPHDAIHSAERRGLCHRLSVRLCVTHRYSVETAKHNPQAFFTFG